MTEKHVNPKIENRKARHDFFLYEKFEAGISLLGCEVKSIREGRINLKDSYIRIVEKEAQLFNCHITPYSHIQGYAEVDPVRSRKLLLHREEIDKLSGMASQKGFSIIPVEMYFKKGKVKVTIALAKGKNQYDKRESIKRKLDYKEATSAIRSGTRKKR